MIKIIFLLYQICTVGLYRCFKKGKIMLPFKIHLDEGSLIRFDELDEGLGDDLEKVDRFFKEIFEMINFTLDSSGVHVQFRIEDKILKTNSYCTEVSPMLAKSKALANSIQDERDLSVGNRILIASCPDTYIDMNSTLEVNDCENILGFMFNPKMNEFKELIIKEILRSISKSPIMDNFEKTDAFKVGICNYINSCVVKANSSVGIYREDW